MVRVAERIKEANGMKKTGVLLLFVLLALSAPATAAQTVINFDDLITAISPWNGTPNPSNGNEDVSIPDGYNGFNWNSYPELTSDSFNMGIIRAFYQDCFTGSPYIGGYAGGGTGNNYTFPTPMMAASNYGANPVNIGLATGAPFDFIGAYFSSWGGRAGTVYTPGATSITLTGYTGDWWHQYPTGGLGFWGGQAAFTLTFDLSTTGFDWVEADFTGIDRLGISSTAGPNGNVWAMDDFTVDADPVPIPPALLLLAPGLLGLAVMRRRFKE
jgi:hypothetical protein